SRVSTNDSVTRTADSSSKTPRRSVPVQGVARAPGGDDIGRIIPLARLPIVRDVVHVAGELEGAAQWRLEVPEVVRAEDMTARTRVGLPSLLGQPLPPHHDLIKVAEVEFDVVQPTRNLRFLDQEQVVMIGRAVGAQEAGAVSVGVGDPKAEPRGIEVARGSEVRHVEHDMSEAARLV